PLIPFSRHKAGRATLRCQKDRGGNYAVGEVVADIQFQPLGAGELLQIDVGPHVDPASSRDEWAPTILMERISRKIIEAPAATLTRSSLTTLFPHAKRAVVDQAIATLLTEGYIVEARGGRGRGRPFRSLRPFWANGQGPSSDRPDPTPVDHALFDDVEYIAPPPPPEWENVLRGPWADPRWVPPDEEGS
ncbi:MAG TPA: hypothetical protein PLV68_06850, partial [Ilumatobacteraceae bacterium]|nr:hypothetical protein [Ilumatobacteraceae bacterium]